MTSFPIIIEALKQQLADIQGLDMELIQRLSRQLERHGA